TEPEPIFRPTPAPTASTADLERRVADLELMVQLLQEQMSAVLTTAAATPAQLSDGNAPQLESQVETLP
ncbi:MAG: hypothetical protein ORN83_06220, partial [Chthoniobacteraceae bacterium]|nr:hypothetical protein [Chthoniobacteraceae bacterium]